MLTVYIVDDSEVMRERIAESVEDIAGIEIVGQSGDPFEALDTIRKSHPDDHQLSLSSVPAELHSRRCGLFFQQNKRVRDDSGNVEPYRT